MSEYNPSDGHAFRAIVAGLPSSLCAICLTWPEEHACDTCGERKGDHTEEMRAKCARGGRVPDCYTCGAKGSEGHNHGPVLPPTCDHCGGIGHTTTDHDLLLSDRWVVTPNPTYEPMVPVSVLERHRDELRAMAEDIRKNTDHLGIGTSLGIARQARCDAYEDICRRLEQDIAEATSPSRP